MLRIKSIIIAGLYLHFSSAASAHNLDSKWASAREQANALGDKAKNGDMDAYLDLKNLAYDQADLPAMNNLGWLYKNGHVAKKDQDKACKWFEKAASFNYPPAMHNYAKCFFTAPDEPFSEMLGRKFMTDAAAAGWTNSAIVLSERILNNANVTSDGARDAYDLSLNALRNTKPSQEDTLSLYYLIGHAAELGPQNRRYYRIGHEALSMAIPRGHPKASAALSRLEDQWGTAVAEDIERFRSYKNSRMKRMADICYKNIAKENPNIKTLGRCKSLTENGFVFAQ